MFPPLHVISVISNPVRYAARYKLYENFAKELSTTPGLIHYTVETAFGEREHAVTKTDNPRHFQFKTTHELWIKENMINLAIARLPSDWKYVAWIDADISFIRKDWVHETIQALQHYSFVQMFQNAIDLGPSKEVIQLHHGFGHLYATGQDLSVTSEYGYGTFGHPGFAWAATRTALDSVGGLIDTGILGAGDHHMALALIGKAHKSFPSGVHSNYIKDVLTWQDRAEHHIRRNVGYVPGSIYHHWHGKKKTRKYQERWDILTKHNFDPHVDVYKDTQGILQLSPHKIGLRDDIRSYFRQRAEDSIDME